MIVTERQRREEARQNMRKAVKADIKACVAEGKLPDVPYRVDFPRTANVARFLGLTGEQFLAGNGYSLRITMSNVSDEYADLDKQTGLRETIFDLVNQHRGDEPFAMQVLTKGHYETGSRWFDDLLEAAIYRAIEEVKKQNGGVLPKSGLILTNVPQPHGWIYD